MVARVLTCSSYSVADICKSIASVAVQLLTALNDVEHMAMWLLG